MSAQEAIRVKNFECKKENMAVLLATHCAPILKGSKIANILTAAKEELSEAGGLLKGTGISFCFLKTRGNKAILYLYRKNKLEEYLSRPEIGKFLQKYGYQEGEVFYKLQKLSERILLYSSGRTEFPHEIGVFLGYPLMDVKGFIENEGKNYAYSGYWKVYHDVPGASRLFLRFDKEREQALNEIASGKTIQEIAAQ